MLNIHFTSPPKARIHPEGINIAIAGTVTLIPCNGSVDSENWFATTFSAVIKPNVTLASDNRRMMVVLENIHIKVPAIQEGPTYELMEALLYGFLRSQGMIVAFVELPLPEGISLNGVRMKFDETYALISSDVVSDQMKMKMNF